MKPSVPCSQPKATYSLRGRKSSRFSIGVRTNGTPGGKSTGARRDGPLIREGPYPPRTDIHPQSKSTSDSSRPQAGGPPSNTLRAHGNTTFPFVVSPKGKASYLMNEAYGPPPGNASMITRKGPSIHPSACGGSRRDTATDTSGSDGPHSHPRNETNPKNDAPCVIIHSEKAYSTVTSPNAIHHNRKEKQNKKEGVERLNGSRDRRSFSNPTGPRSMANASEPSGPTYRVSGPTARDSYPSRRFCFPRTEYRILECWPSLFSFLFYLS